MVLRSSHVVPAIDAVRREQSLALTKDKRSALGQYFTPPSTARLMASMFGKQGGRVHVLDAGSGFGTLFAAVVDELCGRSRPPRHITITAYELDPALAQRSGAALERCATAARQAGVRVDGEVRRSDFLEGCAGGLLSRPVTPPVDLAILNPPYRKLRADSVHQTLLSGAGIHGPNLYSAFIALAVRYLKPGGEMVFISPRSFCNGPYFRRFRAQFLDQMSIRRIHTFHSRSAVFADQSVLQENIILHCVKSPLRDAVMVSSSDGEVSAGMSFHYAPYDEIVKSGDPHRLIRIVTDAYETEVSQRISRFTESLDDLGIRVSTGRVVDFRVKQHLRMAPGPGTVPLVYPCHFDSPFVKWPNLAARKPNALATVPGTQALLVPSRFYVLVRRFSAKEETRRIVPAVYDPTRVPAEQVGFENHLNYFHREGAGLSQHLALGLFVYLSSSLVDAYFRQFSGHTQVNATDLRILPYPSLRELEALGTEIPATPFTLTVADQLMDRMFG